MVSYVGAKTEESCIKEIFDEFEGTFGWFPSVSGLSFMYASFFV